MSTISILSYNIWFDNSMIPERTLSLIHVIETKQPDVICLQEVLPETYHAILYLLIPMGYKHFFPDKFDQKYDCVIISKHPIKKTKTYPYTCSSMGRNLKVTVIEHNDTHQLFVVATTHFESAFKRNCENAAKLHQYGEAQEILNKLSTHYGHVIFGCDTNILKHEEHSFLTNKEPSIWKDSWEEDGSNKNKKFTYDTFTNEHVKSKNYNFIIRNRLDRIIHRGNINVLDFELISKSTNKDLVQPSDHHSVLATLCLN